MFAPSFAANPGERAYRARCGRYVDFRRPFCRQWLGSRAKRALGHRRAKEATRARCERSNLWGRAGTRFALERRASTHEANRLPGSRRRFPFDELRSDAKKRPHPHCGIDPRRYPMLGSCSSRRASFRVSAQTWTGGRALVFCAIRRAHGRCHSFSRGRHELNARTRLHEIQGADQVRFVALARRQTHDRWFRRIL